nr:immunoglobulin light chain junction region [Macaca mulatta]MOW51485.1 immunoglobulin light chain junction region [Macaca mulatta]MOW51505.1 immunoglobulin light chain junction region [Macaca mulatta]MOW51539.1 immunoglobulin light chain junction region [Macaca mulatta]MOW51740.1 immunoglobulin light chain junction region [Macaca mulatta]
CMQALKFPWTF